MAKIRQNEEQLIALEEIEDNIGIIKTINALLLHTETDYSVSCTPDGEKKTIKLILKKSGQEHKKMQSLLLSYKHTLVKEIEKTAKKYKIDLDDEEKMCLLDEQESETTRDNILSLGEADE